MLHAVIMAGGSGTRFWPASRNDNPKQLLAVAGDDPLVVATANRLSGLVPYERIMVVTNARQAPRLREVMPFLPPENIVAEPQPRDTAPCVALAALLVQKKDPEAVMAVLPADHVIRPQADFQATLTAATKIASEKKALVTFGIQPRFPATGYGYIHCGDQVSESEGRVFHRVESFTEKPNEETAKAWLEAGGYFWNSGMFVWQAATILEEISTHAPELGNLVKRLSAAVGTPQWEESLAHLFPQAPRNSIDREIMEKSSRTIMVAADFHWDDLGSWQALPDHHAADPRGNVAVFPKGGLHVDQDSENLVVYAAGDHLVATLGLSGLTIVHTPDATMVCPTDRAQEIKALVDQLKEKGREDVL